MKPWQTKEWREKRKKLIEGKCCEWCGSTEYLTIDHKRNVYPKLEYRKIAWRLFKEYFANGKNRSEFLSLMREALKNITIYYWDACPVCKSRSVYIRKTKKPKYRCSRCGYEFDTPLKTIKESTKIFVLNRMVKLFAKYHKEEIDEIYKPHIQKLNEDYFNFKEVLILCRRCAFARLKGYVLCPVCKKHYYKPVGNRKMCWHCFIKTEEGKKKLQEWEELEQEGEELDEEESEFFEEVSKYESKTGGGVASSSD